MWCECAMCIELWHSLGEADIDNISVCSGSLTFSGLVLGDTRNMPTLLHGPLKLSYYMQPPANMDIFLIAPCESEKSSKVSTSKALEILTSLKDTLEMCHYSRNSCFVKVSLLIRILIRDSLPQMMVWYCCAVWDALSGLRHLRECRGPLLRHFFPVQ